MLELDAGCQLHYDLNEGMKFLQRLSLSFMTESSGSPQSLMQDQSLEEQCSEVLKRIREYLKFCYDTVISAAMVESCVGDEILVFKEKLLKSEMALVDLSLALVGKKASVCCFILKVAVYAPFVKIIFGFRLWMDNLRACCTSSEGEAFRQIGEGIVHHVDQCRSRITSRFVKTEFIFTRLEHNTYSATDESTFLFLCYL